jgi:pimeloyl-ACP methyl ester carboxylesterase
MNAGAKRSVVISLCVISVCCALGIFSSAADAAAQSFGTVGAVSGAADAQPFGAFGALTSRAQAGPDPSLVGDWAVKSMCSGSPCGDTIIISIGGQPSDPACSADAYCITTVSGFYGIDVSVTPNGAGTWTYTCDGCTGSEDISVDFDGPTFTGTATGIAPDGTETGTVPYDGTCNDCVADSTHTVSGTVKQEVCGASGCNFPGDGGVNVLVTGTDSDGNAVSETDVSAADGSWSVKVPPGSYTAGPSQDGTTFGPPGFIPPSQALTVSTQDVTGVDFVAASPLSVTSVKFQQPNVATGAMEAVPPSGTIDGNSVDVIATVQNKSGTAQQADVNFGNPIDDSATLGATRSNVTVPADGSVDVDEVLNTSGLAWSDDGSPDPQRVIQVSVAGVGASVAGVGASATLTVRPKPVILVHGLLSDAGTWAAYVGGGGFLANQNVLWRGYAVGDGQAPGLMDTSPFSDPGNTIAQNANEEAIYIRGVRDATDAEHVDIVAHSMGGLISRFYVQNLMPGPPAGDSGPVVSHLVMLGTPNEGSNCAYYPVAVAQLFGGKGTISPSNQPLLQLTPVYMAHFDSQITDRKDVPFSILAGDGFHGSVCTSAFLSGSSTPNDGVVTVTSAEWEISDRTVEPLIHTSETGSETAFSDWVKPHLALGPGSTGGGTYLGPLGSSIRYASRARVASAALSVASASRVINERKLCLATTPAPTLAAGATEKVSAAHGAAVAIAVPAHAGTLDAVVLAQPTVTTTLTDPSGHVVESVEAGSAGAGGLFRTLIAQTPRRGRWHLSLSEARGAPGSSVEIAVHFAHSPVQLTLSLSHPRAKGKRANLLFTARVRNNGRSVSRATVVLKLLIAGKRRAVVLHLHAVRGHRGSYSATIAQPSIPAVVLARATAKAGATSAELALQNGCSKAR